MTQKSTVLIVGASRGLGFALAEEYCGRDWQVIATVRRTSERLNALEALPSRRSTSMTPIRCARCAAA
jgi:NAD(P)-dependent dehydrogenase (short-subunit alcohol dehydrogenase family)